jgi:4-aminobutyrate aminotransferase / (S)-3-amino-2-methylpropionate transaminase / 5-aminovalerate transaminase
MSCTVTRKQGLIILACDSLGNVTRVLMLLVISGEQLDKGMTILEETIAALSAK